LAPFNARASEVSLENIASIEKAVLIEVVVDRRTVGGSARRDC
jgi:hypothetical protein